MDKKPRFIILTAGWTNGRLLAHLLWQLGIQFEVVTIAPSLPKRGQLTPAKYIIKLVLAQLRSFGVFRTLAHRKRLAYPVPYEYAGPCNSKRLINILKKKKPDYILMMGGGILSRETISIARLGVLNTHPGILPWIRGVDVILCSVLRGIALGATGHYIDKDIDTGPIISRYLLPVSPGDSFFEISKRMEKLTIAIMWEMVLKAWEGKSLGAIAQAERFEICRKLKKSDRILAREKIVDGEALKLYLEEKNTEIEILDGGALLKNIAKLLPKY